MDWASRQARSGTSQIGNSDHPGPEVIGEITTNKKQTPPKTSGQRRRGSVGKRRAKRRGSSAASRAVIRNATGLRYHRQSSQGVPAPPSSVSRSFLTRSQSND